MEISKEWIATLSATQRRMASRFKSKRDFAVLGDAMPFVRDLARMFDYNLVEVRVQTLDDLRGKVVARHDEESGYDYYEYDVEWRKAIEGSERVSLLVFHIDDADDRLVSALKSTIGNRGDNYFIGLVCADVTRHLERTTTYDLVKPVIVWE